MSALSRKTALAACIAVALLSLWDTQQFWRASAPLTQLADPYGIAARHDRFTALISKLSDAKLPPVKTLDFITAAADSSQREMLYYDAAYELAPRFVLPDANPPSRFVVGSFPQPIDPRLIAQATGLLVVEDFGGGVVLFRRP